MDKLCLKAILEYLTAYKNVLDAHKHMLVNGQENVYEIMEVIEEVKREMNPERKPYKKGDVPY